MSMLKNCLFQLLYSIATATALVKSANIVLAWTTSTTTICNLQHCIMRRTLSTRDVLITSSTSRSTRGSTVTSKSTSTSVYSQHNNNNRFKNGCIVHRSRFVSSSVTTFLLLLGLVTAASEPEQCSAFEFNFWKQFQQGTKIPSDMTFINPSSKFNNNPRYIEKEVQVNMNLGSDGDTNPRYRGVLVRRITGDSTPYKFPIRPIKLVKTWPDQQPFTPDDFSRTDPTNDGVFYSFPKLVYHIDEPAVSSLTQYYRQNIAPKSTILDICSSWVSHYPIEFPNTMDKICATGMNPIELQLNDQLTGGYVARDLNEQPTLPYDDETFDVVTCVVSIDYLIQPIAVLKEVNRVLKPNGKVIISQSNRCFPTKAIKMWLQMNDRQHLELINGFLQYAGGYNIPASAYDITATVPDNSYRDPMFIIEATKK